MKSVLLLVAVIAFSGCASNYANLPDPENYGIDSPTDAGTHVYSNCQDLATSVANEATALTEELRSAGSQRTLILFDECMADNGFPLLSSLRH
jgi:hypothetical protein